MNGRVEALRRAGHATILAFESSCDETAVAVVRDGREALANQILSQIDRHAVFGGVVPEIASRMHVEALDPLLDAALSEAGMTLEDIDAVAVTCGPGLVGALLTAVSYAKALAYARGLPLVAVNHIEGHVSANYLAHPDLEPPFACLVASGGHSHIVLVERYGEYRLLGQTLDDAAGEAFDKVARVLDIPYPGGPLLDKLAEDGDDGRYRFPHTHTPGKYDFSFSGLKTAVINEVHNAEQKGQPVNVADMAASFQERIDQILAKKLLSAASDTGAKQVVLAGGVAANGRLRQLVNDGAQKLGARVFLPELKYCGDNGAMIAAQGYYEYQDGNLADWTLNGLPTLGIDYR